jgi:opacity protein-like surface antigen
MAVSGTITPLLPAAHAESPTVVAAEADRPSDAGRMSQAEQAALSERPVRYEQISIRPSEGYFAGFAGYTFGGKFDPDGIGTLGGVNFGNRTLADSVVYGAKAGGFFSDQLNWLGAEAELFNTTPNIKQEGAAAGSHMRVTTLAVNLIARAQFACTKRIDHEEKVTERVTIQYEQEFCRLQPYAGVGLGINWVDISNSTFSAHANFVAGLNVLGGLRYYFTERIAMFTEYKYNRATFDFVGSSAPLTGFQGIYSINHIVGGISYHY